VSDPAVVLPIVSLVAIAAVTSIGLRRRRRRDEDDDDDDDRRVRRDKHDGRRPATPVVAPDTAALARFDARISRLEQSLDVIAVEIERVGESQRFLTKLLTDRTPPSLDDSSEA